jgi:choice-of-anchor B domain-containing protein
LTTLLTLPLTSPAHHPDHLQCQQKRQDLERVWIRGCGHDEPLVRGEAGAREFIEHHASDLGLPTGNIQLTLVDEQDGLTGTRTLFQQTIEGLPVYGRTISVNQRDDGSVDSLYASYRETATGSNVPKLTPGEAEAIAIATAQVETTRLPATRELVWFPRPNGMATLAWKVMVFSENPLGDFLTLVDAELGKLLLQENRLVFDTGTGLVFDPNPIQTAGNAALSDNGDQASAALNAERVSVTLLGLDSGISTLKGEFVDLVSLSGGKPGTDASDPTRTYLYDRSEYAFEQGVIYRSIDSMNRYFHTLGFDDDVGAQNGIRDFPTLAHAHWDDADQSFYSTGDNAVHFGDGGVDDGEDADIIAHEYGHAIQHDQNACWGGGEMGAMGEGFGDYLAASFYAGRGDAAFQNANAACVGEWDASSYSGSNPPCLRRVDGNKQYPTDLVGQVHADGEIWSRALWDIRTAIGATTADRLILEHHFHLTCNATMPDAANEILAADTNLNGGANGAAIRAAFCSRGILSGASCSAPAELMLGQTISPDPAEAGKAATYTLTATNTSPNTLNTIALTANVPAGSSYASGSASNGGAESAGTVTWPAVTVAPGAQVTRTFQVLVDAGASTVTLFQDDMESGTSKFSATNGAGSVNWALGTTNPHNPKAGVLPRYAKSTTCSGGSADIYPCENVDLLAYLPMSSIGGGEGNDGWGWTDPQDGKEYAIMGRSSGTSFLDISDPANPVYLGDLPTHTVNSDWRDVKVHQDHAFIVSEASNHGMQVFDLTLLRSVTNPPVTLMATSHYAAFGNAHNIAINTDSGFAYAVGTNTCSGGLHMVDVTVPANPTSAGCFSGDGYTHDVQCVVYAGPDPAHTNKELCFASNEDTLTIVDVTNKSAPVQLSRTSYAGVAYSHQGWLTDDQRYFLMDDELDEQQSGHNTRTYVWDVADPDSPTLVGSHDSSLAAIDHNLYIVDDLVYQANYRAGLTILRIEDLSNASLCEVGSFDVYPASNTAQFNGAWNVYPFFSSGVVVINAIEGLGLVRPQLAGINCSTPPLPPESANAWFAADPPSLADQYLAMDQDVSVTAGTTLSFWHDFSTESGYDGGVLEVSTDAGTNWSDLGAQITQNGYTGPISQGYSSPIGGRSAYEGTSGGYQQTLVDLSPQAGENLRVRFRMASDLSVSGLGWYVDDVHIGSQVSLTSSAAASGSASQTSSLTTNVISPTNSAPVVSVNSGLTLDEGAAKAVGTANLRTTDADPGDTLAYAVTSAPVAGTLNMGSSFTQSQIDANSLIYTHDGSETTSDAFGFTVNDGNGGTASGTFVISVTPGNDPPTLAINTGLTVGEGATTTIQRTALETTDPDAGTTLTYTVISSPSAGNLNLGSTFTQAQINASALSYTHDGSETTSDTFDFSASDGDSGVVTGTFSITVTPLNDLPVVTANVGLTLIEGGSNPITPSQLATTDPDATSGLTYTVVTGPAAGILNLGTTFTQAQIDAGALSYTHDGSETTSDAFSFTVSDGDGGSASSSFAITIAPSNDPPIVTTNAGLTLPEGATESIGTSLLATADPDPGAVSTYTVTALPSAGTLSLGTNFTQLQIDANLLSYTHDGLESTGDSFSFTVSDGNGEDASGVFLITITPTNDPPVLGLASLPPATAGELFSVTFTPTDPDVGDSLSVATPGAPSWLTAPTENLNGSWTISGTPEIADVGESTLTVQVSDDATPPAVDQEQLALVVDAPVPGLSTPAALLLATGVIWLGRRRLRRGGSTSLRHDGP